MKSSAMTSSVIILLLLLTGIAFANQQPIDLSNEQRDELNIFFSNFAEAFPGYFADGQISDDELIRFALLHIIRNRTLAELRSMGDRHGGIPPVEVDKVTSKYFDKIVASHHSIPFYAFENGHYKLFKLGGVGLSFSRIQSLYDNGDGTYTAIVYVYTTGDQRAIVRIESVYRNDDGSYTVKGVGYVDFEDSYEPWEDRARLQGERKAIIKPVYDDGKKRYILLGYQN